jgi:hypothetical protein
MHSIICPTFAVWKIKPKIVGYGYIDTGDYGSGGGPNAGLFHIQIFFV